MLLLVKATLSILGWQMKHRTYTYLELDDFGITLSKEITGEDILREYFDYWSGEMVKAGKSLKISEDKCIQDWCTIHYAEVLDDPYV